jgi:ABC-type bacteriocin/lantibiotic exporter with double-glycine peptidase domain
MVLAQQGIRVAEDELVRSIDMPAGGVNPEELCRLARQYGLRASEKQLDRGQFLELLRDTRYPIIFLHRKPIDRVDAGHAVMPIRFSARFVTFLDPLRGERRVSIQKFEEARRLVGRWAVVWERS